MYSDANRFSSSMHTLRRSAYYGAQTILYCALDDDVVEHSGGYFYDCARQELYPHAKDEQTAKKLWQESVKVTKLA